MEITNLSFADLLDWFRGHDAYEYLLLYVSDFYGDGEQRLDKLIHERRHYDRSTDRHIFFACFLNEQYFKKDINFAYVKNMHDPGKDPDFYSRLPKGAAPLDDKILGCRRIDISATVKALDEIYPLYSVMQKQLPAFVMIPRKKIKSCIVYSLKNDDDITKFFGLLDKFMSYRRDCETLDQQLSSVEEIQRELLQLEETICDISNKIPLLKAGVQKKEEEFMPVLREYLQLPADFHPALKEIISPKEIISLLREQGKLEEFFHVKKMHKFEKRKLRKQDRLETFLTSEENQKVGRNQECFQAFREEFDKWDFLERQLDQAKKRKDELISELNEKTQCCEIQQALAFIRKQLEECNSEFLKMLQDRYSMTEEQGQKILREVNSRDWVSFESFKILIANLQMKPSVPTQTGYDISTAHRSKNENNILMPQNDLKRDTEYDVFISYSSKNQNVADAMCHFLEEKRIRCWMAPRDIPPGQEYAETIALAISKVKVFILVLSSFSAASQWVKSETNMAMDRKKKIIPFVIEDCPIAGTAMETYVNNRQWIKAFLSPNQDQAFDHLAKEILQGQDETAGSNLNRSDPVPCRGWD